MKIVRRTHWIALGLAATALPALLSGCGASPAGGATARVGSAPAAPLRTRDITFDTVKFNMRKGAPFRRSMLTPQIKALDGKMIRIRGYMYPSFKQYGLTQFMLVRDNQQCCFGPGAALFDCMLVEMDAGKSTEYSLRPVAVEGVFNVRELISPDDKCVAIYHLQGMDVK